MKPYDELKLLNVEEVSRILEVTKKTVTRYCHQENGLPYYKIGNKFRFSLNDVLNFKNK
jgi:excisionase family DNA binding protein